jgi:hypothetical protein
LEVEDSTISPEKVERVRYWALAEDQAWRWLPLKIGLHTI